MKMSTNALLSKARYDALFDIAEEKGWRIEALRKKANNQKNQQSLNDKKAVAQELALSIAKSNKNFLKFANRKNLKKGLTGFLRFLPPEIIT